MAKGERKPRVSRKAQVSMDDTIIRDEALESDLETRATLHEQVKKNLGAYNEFDKKVKAQLAKMEDQMPFRVGRFIISKVDREARHVEFDAEGSSSISIKPADK